ncbi:Amidohydrolase [Catalinimonas alkaloidigena]|uniref:Amidohydrolase n=1 Tax=Catalinimonas alkaloidigena TaxID=1075417 RepID=A0A1G9A361_9BACT|nr:amidohydrolase family protein [Catalinimonas alkaloidigena]SDK21792.1 Amidohydrolase [Catalinimonas alkaloidigena]
MRSLRKSWRVCLLLLCGCMSLRAQAQRSPEELLLKDYRPVSIYRTPHTHVQRAKYPAIDFHAHPLRDPAVSVADWVAIMDSLGIDKSVVLTYATGPLFDSLAGVYGQYPERFILFCGFDYSGYDQPGFGPAAVAELERCYRMGARGVGELGDKGKGLFYSKPVPAYGMHIDDPRMAPLLEKCADLHMPISIHVAEPIWMYQPMDSTNDGLMNAFTWRLDDQPDIVDHAGMIKILENAVRQHPRTTFVACHYANCSYDLTILGRLFDRYPNLYADIAARYAETAPIPRYVAAFYKRYANRLVYGTDMGVDPAMYRTTFRMLETSDEHFYEHDLFGYHWVLSGWDLPDAVLKKVYRSNARKLLR